VRVLMLNERDLSHPLAGGVEVHLEETARRLAADHGIETTVLAAGFPGAVADETRDGVRYLRFGDRGFSYYAMLPGRARAAWATGRYDLVVENLCKLLFFSKLYLASAPRLGLVHHLFGLSAFRQVSVPIASYVVSTEALLPLAYRRCPMVVVSPSTRDDLVRRGLRRDLIRVVPNGLDHRIFRPADPPRVDSDLVLFVGRLEYYKGVDLLLESWPKVRATRPKARLVVVGAGNAEAAMRSRAAALGLGESVHFAGFVSQEAKVEWLQRAALLVQPSRKEGWGLTVLEANACGTPVVATRVPGLRDSVRDGETGILVPSADSDALAAGIAGMLDDTDLRSRLARGALAWAARFRWEAVTSALAACLRAAARRSPLPDVPDFLASTHTPGAPLTMDSSEAPGSAGSFASPREGARRGGGGADDGGSAAPVRSSPPDRGSGR
jgi:glycosyltransferase involved in cell wall biosynthesis